TRRAAARGGSDARSTSPTRTRPPRGRRIPPATRRHVVLPAPLRPTSATTSPGSTESVTSWIASARPYPARTSIRERAGILRRLPPRLLGRVRRGERRERVGDERERRGVLEVDAGSPLELAGPDRDLERDPQSVRRVAGQLG